MTWLLAILGLGLLVTVHEFGHFIVAKWTGMKVEVFSIGFGPAVPGLKWHWGETEFRISWIFLGGYVKIKGQDPYDEEDSDPDDPRAYSNKSPIQRLAVIAAGPGINYLFAIVLGLVVFGYQGIPRQPENYPLVLAQVMAGKPAAKAGLKPGDIISAIDGHKVKNYLDYKHVIGLYLQGCRPAEASHRYLDLQVERNNAVTTVRYRPPKRAADEKTGQEAQGDRDAPKTGRLAQETTTLGFHSWTAPSAMTWLLAQAQGIWVVSVHDQATGLLPGDRILVVDGRKASSMEVLLSAMQTLKKGYRCPADAEHSLIMTIVRGEKTLDKKIYPDENGLIGVEFQEALQWEDAPMGKRLLAAIVYPMDKSREMLDGFRRLFSGLVGNASKVASQVSGPVGIVVAVKTRMKRGFWQGLSVLMFLSVMLGFFNILPLPALDGGHVVFRLIELVTGKRLSPIAEAKIHYYGILVLMALLVLVTIKDCRGLFGI